MVRPVLQPTKRFGHLARLVVWIAGLILILQLLGATQHRHDLAHAASDCVACVLAGQPPSPPSPPVMPQVSVSQATSYYVLAQSNPSTLSRPVSFLIPHAHAPPPGFM